MATTKKPAAKKAAPKSSAKTTAKKATAAVESAKKDVTEQASSIVETVKTNLNNVQNVAKQVWFANLGLVGRSVDRVQERLENVNKEGRELIDTLVARGEKVQDDAEVLLQERRANIEEQIEAAKNRLNNFAPIADISERVKGLTEKLESLSKDFKKAA